MCEGKRVLLKFPFGKGFLQTDVREELLEVVSSRSLKPIEGLDEAIQQSLRVPIQSKPIRSWGKNKRVCVIVPDNTRACPTNIILPLVLKEIEHCHPKELNVIVGNGLHPSLSRTEMIEFLGANTVDEYDVTNHVATDDKQLVNFEKKTSYGTPVIVNKTVAKSDHVIGIGLVEPHFFAGYSGGRKTVLPSVAGKQAIFNNHSFKMLSHPNADYGVLNGNPIHQDMMEFMKFVNLSFIVNAVINHNGEVSQIFAGDAVEAHEQATRFLHRCVSVRPSSYADIVMVSNGGYPLDRNLYQSVKGLATAKRVVRRGGVIIMITECRDGLGSHEEFKELIKNTETPQEVLKTIREGEPIKDQWEAQILAEVLDRAKVILVTLDENSKLAREMKMEPVSTIRNALDLARKILNDIRKPRIVAIPEGPYVIPSLIESA